MPKLEDIEPPPISIDDCLSSGIRHPVSVNSGDQDELESIQQDDSETIGGHQHSIPEGFEGKETPEKPQEVHSESPSSGTAV